MRSLIRTSADCVILVTLTFSLNSVSFGRTTYNDADPLQYVECSVYYAILKNAAIERNDLPLANTLQYFQDTSISKAIALLPADEFSYRSKLELESMYDVYQTSGIENFKIVHERSCDKLINDSLVAYIGM